MKKFIIITTIIVLLLVIFNFVYYELGIFIDLNPNKEVTTFVKTKEKSIILKTDENYEEFEIKGVNLGSGIPGHFATDYAIDKETYLRWFKYIQDMGANTIRIYTILNDDFYNAFYEYNKNNENPLYLIHGLWVNDYIHNSRVDAYSSEFLNAILKESKKVVDVIHGKRQITIGSNSGTGFYFKDISDWVIGYILGVEWEDTLVSFTNNMQKDKNTYIGKYFKTKENATPFEALLAQVGDKIIAYESTRYKTQRLVAFSNWPTTDPFDYSKPVTEYFKKSAKVDVEHLETTDDFISGTFASYHIYPYYPDYLNYETEFNKYQDENGIKNTYQAYLKKINEYHTIPVVISEFGVPSSRGMAQKDQNTNRNQGMLNEQQQGEAIINCYKDIKSAGINNAIIFTWQDEWFKRTWNTMHATDLTKTPYWSDYQTNEQYFGLLSFDPGTNSSISYVDGNILEWQDKDIILNNENMTLSMKYDEKFIYFYINNYNNQKLYLPIDTTYKSGSKKYNNLSFERDADFLIIIDGKDNSRVLVQDRYNTTKAMFGYEVYQKNSFLYPPNKDSSNFEPITLLLQTATDLLSNTSKAEIYETGKLTYGNANPDSEEFNSLADFIIKDNIIEIKIPWGLLNFSDPSNMQIHDDYYEKYGVSNIKINSMYVGIGTGNQTIKMGQLKLKGWGKNITYHERLKKSYYMVQEMWKGSDK